MHRRFVAAFAACLALLGTGLPASAQMNGHNFTGDFGLMAGTQPAPGWTVLGMYVNYDIDTLRDRNGDELPGSGSLSVQALSPMAFWVSDYKILGANYAVMVAPSLTTNSLSAPILGLDLKTSWGLADLYIQPVNLGWHTDRADFTAGLGFFAPTGSYEVGADDNIGLGMWSFEVFGGTTLFLDSARSWHLSAMAAWETHTKKENTDLRVGDLLTLEGGLGRSWMDGALSAGLVYYGQWKVSEDDFGLDILTFPKHRRYGAGAEVSLPIATKKKLIGLVSFRYYWEFGARTTTEGQALVVTASFPIPSIPLQ